MGQAKRKEQVGATAQYKIEIIKDPGKSFARLNVINARITALTAEILGRLKSEQLVLTKEQTMLTNAMAVEERTE
ncbi:MAG: hypothetical protein KKF00_03240 [Proteobacteria bacterium]|nr:hypothetical protein [Pseudomonadota bacterium]